MRFFFYSGVLSVLKKVIHLRELNHSATRRVGKIISHAFRVISSCPENYVMVQGARKNTPSLPPSCEGSPTCFLVDVKIPKNPQNGFPLGTRHGRRPVQRNDPSPLPPRSSSPRQPSKLQIKSRQARNLPGVCRARQDSILCHEQKWQHE